MQNVDVILLSLTSSPSLFRMTQATIASLRQSEKDIHFNIIIVESNKNYRELPLQYKDEIIIPPGEFNYNRFVSIGLRYCSSDWVCIINNDLHFRSGWFTEILNAYSHFNGVVKSFGTWNNETHRHHFDGKEKYYPGYIVPKHVSGWCIVARREIFEQIKFDSVENQRVNFWYSDSIYADLLEKNNIIHVLCRDSLVDHIQNGTIRTMPSNIRNEWMKGQWENYLKGKPA